MKSAMLLWTAVACLAASARAQSEVADKEMIYGEIRKASAKLTTLQADMVQHRISSFMASEVVTKSKFYYKKPGLFRLKPKKKEENEYIINDRTVWIINHMTKEVLVTKSEGANFSRYIVGFGNTIDELERVFHITAMVPIVDKKFRIYELQLTPRENSDLYDKLEDLRIFFRDDLWVPFRAEITEIDGDQTIWQFSKFKLNKNIKDKDFEQKLRKGYIQKSLGNE